MSRHVLTALGVNPESEDVYHYLLQVPGATATQVVRGCGLSRWRVRRALDELEGKGMVGRHGGSSPSLHPAPPEIVVEALVATREADAQRARLEAWRLAQLQRPAPEQTEVSELVELLTTAHGSSIRWNQMQAGARTSVEAFVRPPFTHPRAEDTEPIQQELLSRDVTFRALYDHAALQHPGIMEHAQRMASLGEQSRVVSELPLKLVLVDRTQAMLPFMQLDPEGSMDAGLVVHRSTLLEAVIALFDLYWERGTELRVGGRDSMMGVARPPEEAILTLMAAGYKDEAIANQLGLSTATVRRRISALQRQLRVDTRFQVGLALGRTGWRSGDVEATGRADRPPPR